MSSEIVTEMAKEFDIDSLIAKEQNTLKGNPIIIPHTGSTGKRQKGYKPIGEKAGTIPTKEVVLQ